MIKIYNTDLFAIVDDEYSWLKKYRWTLHKNKERKKSNSYAKCSIKSKRYLMHKIIMNEKNRFVDHINGNGLDNRLKNLRYCTNSQNLLNRGKAINNTSGYKGVWFRKDRNTYVAELTVNKKRVIKKSFKSINDAIAAYNNAVTIHAKEFGFLNKMETI